MWMFNAESGMINENALREACIIFQTLIGLAHKIHEDEHLKK